VVRKVNHYQQINKIVLKLVHEAEFFIKFQCRRSITSWY